MVNLQYATQSTIAIIFRLRPKRRIGMLPIIDPDTMATSTRKPRSNPVPPSPTGITPIYDSALMHERRQRILQETRRVIEENGIENLSMRELCKRADVAQRTLYNAFGSKDRIVGLAIQENYIEQVARMKFTTAADTMEGVIERLARVCMHFGRQRNYMKAVMDLYFAPPPHKDTIGMMRELSFENVRPWLRQLEQRKLVNPCLSLEQIESDMTDLAFSVMRKWTIGEIGVTRMAEEAVRGFLVLAVGSTVGEAQARAVRALAQRSRRPALARAKVG
jgi:AcrR family transcriptional regulator